MADGDFEILTPLFRRDDVFADEEGFYISSYRGQGGAEVVRYVGNQFPPLEIDLPERRNLLLDPPGHPAEGRLETFDLIPGLPAIRHGKIEPFEGGPVGIGLHRGGETLQPPRQPGQHHQPRRCRHEESDKRDPETQPENVASLHLLDHRVVRLSAEDHVEVALQPSFPGDAGGGEDFFPLP